MAIIKRNSNLEMHQHISKTLPLVLLVIRSVTAMKTLKWFSYFSWNFFDMGEIWRQTKQKDNFRKLWHIYQLHFSCKYLKRLKLQKHSWLSPGSRNISTCWEWHFLVLNVSQVLLSQTFTWPFHKASSTGLFDSNEDHNLQSEHRVVLSRTSN